MDGHARNAVVVGAEFFEYNQFKRFDVRQVKDWDTERFRDDGATMQKVALAPVSQGRYELAFDRRSNTLFFRIVGVT
ncbi:MAG: hypothetical protein FOGNACKC_00880 [Anaerolineae bacterium]|nr:hypothetical protein [Anaerolineae bacterium]